MDRRTSFIAAGALAIACLFNPLGALAEIVSGKVVAVADGDTLTVLDRTNTQYRIRLAEIDAPEGAQAFGNRSKRLLSDLRFLQQARVEVTTEDRYGRKVGFVVCRGLDANAELVREGLAWVYVRYARTDSPYFALERTARSAQIGLWSDSSAVAPWEWRRGIRTPEEAGRRDSTVIAGVRGNRNSRVYHLAHCPSFDLVSAANRVLFDSEDDAKESGFRRAGNCT